MNAEEARKEAIVFANKNYYDKLGDAYCEIRKAVKQGKFACTFHLADDDALRIISTCLTAEGYYVSHCISGMLDIEWA